MPELLACLTRVSSLKEIVGVIECAEPSTIGITGNSNCMCHP